MDAVREEVRTGVDCVKGNNDKGKRDSFLSSCILYVFLLFQDGFVIPMTII